jgi:hypothetical protein
VQALPEIAPCAPGNAANPGKGGARALGFGLFPDDRMA